MIFFGHDNQVFKSVVGSNSVDKGKVSRYSLTLLERVGSEDKEPYGNISDIKQMGDKVIIRTIPTASVSKYTKNMNLTWDDISSDPVEMNVDRAIIYKGKMDKVDLAQLMNKQIMDEYATDAAEQQKIYIDEEFLGEVYADAATANKGIAAGRKSGLYNLGVDGAAIALTETNVLKYILMCEAVGNEQNWPITGRWLALPTWAQFLLSNSDIKDASFAGGGSSTLLRGGRIGKISNFEILTTNLYTAIAGTGADSGDDCYPILFGHKAGICFATQFTEMEYFDKLETTVGKAMRGIQVYDWKVVKPEAMGVLYAKMG